MATITLAELRIHYELTFANHPRHRHPEPPGRPLTRLDGRAGISTRAAIACVRRFRRRRDAPGCWVTYAVAAVGR